MVMESIFYSSFKLIKDFGSIDVYLDGSTEKLGLNKEIINVNGGAIALGHPLGCTGAKLSVQLFDEMRKRNMKNKYGMVTMCVGTGQGAAGIFEFLN